MKSLYHRSLLPILSIILLMLIDMSLFAAQSGNEKAINATPQTDIMLRITVILFLALMVIGVFTILYILQRQFLEVCKEKGNLQLYAEAPFGVPSGTIRSILALSIVFASIGYLAMSMLHTEVAFPEMMVGILGSVLGFYFGSRGTTSRTNEEALERISTANKERDDAIKNASQGKLSNMVEKARTGVAVAKALNKVLPTETAKKLEGIINTVDQGIKVAGGLAGAGKTTEALSEVGKALEKLKGDNPVKDLLVRATASFGKVLGGVVPPLAIASVVVAIGSKLAGAAYGRWVARVLNAPYTPELFPPTVIDSSVAMSIMRSSPIFSHAFANEILTGDLATLRNVVRHALTDNPDETLWEQPDMTARFADQEELDKGIAELQRAAMSEEVMKDIDPADMAPAGGFDQFMNAIDEINADENAQRDIDALVLMMDELKKQNQPVEPVFKEALEYLHPETSA